MAMNRRPTSPGQLQSFEASARISTNTPSAAVDTGDGWRALAGIGGHFGQRLGRLADEAAAREGELAGLNAGQRAGVSYTAMQSAQTAAVSREGGYDLTQHLVDPSRVDHIAGLKPEFHNRLAAMFAGAPENIRGQVSLVSGYRSNERQAELYQAALKKYGSEAAARKWVAPPGHSRHNHGDAYDLRYGSDAARDWVHANAGQFGLVFPMSHEPWHIEMPEARGNTPAPAEGVTVLSTEPLALRSDGTIRGQAFDRAAMSSYSWRMQAGLTNDLAAAYEANKDSPAGYAAAIAGIRQTYQADATLGDPRLNEVFERTFVERTMAAQRDIAARQEARLRGEQRAAVGEGIDAFTRDIERQAYLLGMDPNADQILGAQAERMLSGINAAVDDGVLTPAEGARYRTNIASSMANSRIMGVFNALETPAQKEQFALGLLDEWAQGSGPMEAMSYDQVRALSHTLFSQARSQQNQLTAEQRAEAARFEGLINDDIASIAASGVGIDMAETGLTPEAVELLLGPEALTRWQGARALAERGWEAINGMDQETPGEMDARLQALAPVPGSAGFETQQAIYAQALKQKDEILKRRAVDPLGQAHEAGLVELAPIDGSSVEALNGSLGQRAEQARVISSVWGTPPTVFRAGERDALAAALVSNPDMLPGFALSVAETFGPLAPVALSELSEAGPALAHAAGITLATGNSSVAADVARTIAAKQAGQLRASMPNDARFLQAASPVLGSAFSALPGTQSAVLETAQLLYEREANYAGFNPADVDRPDTPANAAFMRALDRALGASMVSGIKYGGVADINGQSTVVPPDLPADAVSRAMRNIAIDDLQTMGIEPMGANGVSLNPEQLRNGRLVAVAQGQYRIALGDPLGFDAQYVLDQTGDPFVLDISELIFVQNLRGATQSDRAVEGAAAGSMIGRIGGEVFATGGGF